MSEPEEKDLLSDGPSLSADGRLEKRLEAVESPGFKPPEAAPLELEERFPSASRAPEVGDFRPDAPRRPAPSRGRGVVLALLGLGVVLLVGFAVVKPRLGDFQSPDGVSESTVLDKLALGTHEPMIVESTPPGAKITIAGEVVGQTPWAGDNRWLGTVKISLEAPGYRTWEGTFEGGKSVTLNAPLKK